MRAALIFASLALLAGCGGSDAPVGPERRSAAGEVLGGEISDDMLPLDTVRSTSPAGRNAPDEDGNDPASAKTSAPPLQTPAARPSVEAAPAPDMTMPADPEPLRPPEE